MVWGCEHDISYLASGEASSEFGWNSQYFCRFLRGASEVRLTENGEVRIVVGGVGAGGRDSVPGGGTNATLANVGERCGTNGHLRTPEGMTPPDYLYLLTRLSRDFASALSGARAGPLCRPKAR
jgi:hypothetical protein